MRTRRDQRRLSDRNQLQKSWAQAINQLLPRRETLKRYSTDFRILLKLVALCLSG